jgi:hypothetical protein
MPPWAECEPPVSALSPRALAKFNSGQLKKKAAKKIRAALGKLARGALRGFKRRAGRRRGGKRRFMLLEESAEQQVR